MARVMARVMVTDTAMVMATVMAMVTVMVKSPRKNAMDLIIFVPKSLRSRKILHIVM